MVIWVICNIGFLDYIFVPIFFETMFNQRNELIIINSLFYCFIGNSFLKKYIV